MCKMMLSINPEYVINILNGSKKYEYRKIKCKRKVDKILIYSTHPVMRVVGEAKVEKVLEDTPQNIWNITKESSGVDLKFYRKYYEGREKAIAYKLSEVKKYDESKSLSDYGLIYAPQSFTYIN